MFSMSKSRELDEVQRQDADVNRRHYGEDVKFYQFIYQSEVPFHSLQKTVSSANRHATTA